jgi:shikimate dehydrogenase
VPEDLTLQIDDLRALRGFNITIPHKVEIIPFLDHMDDSAQRYQSVNCVANQNGNLIGYNTDCDGFLRSVAAFPLDGKVLLTGCGGAGRMMATEAVLHGADLTIGILERHLPMVRTFLAELKEMMPDAKVRYALTAELDEPFDFLMNSTPVGMYPNTDAMPLSESLLEQCGSVFDVIYNPTETKLIQKAKAMGKPVCGGAAMLVWQAVKAHEIWNGDTYTNEQIQALIAEMEAEIQRLFPVQEATA